MKILHIVKLFLLLFCIMTSSVYAAKLSIDLDPTTATIDDTLTVAISTSFDIDIIVDNALDFAGFEFDLNFDSSIVNATTVLSGNVFGADTFLIENQISTNSISFSEISLSFFGLDIASPTVLATISFEAIGAGTDFLSLSNVFLSDSFGFAISTDPFIDATVSVSAAPAAVPVPGALILMLSGLTALGFSKRITTTKS